MVEIKFIFFSYSYKCRYIICIDSEMKFQIFLMQWYFFLLIYLVLREKFGDGWKWNFLRWPQTIRHNHVKSKDMELIVNKSK